MTPAGEQLCYVDAYARSVTARVRHVETGEAALVVLDRTVFYPGGGGQPSDRGLLLRPSAALPGDVQYRVIEEGNGKQVMPTSEVTFHVRVSLTSGREIRSSFVGDPIKAKVSDMAGMFGTKTLPEVIQKMKVGDHWSIFLPPDPSSGNQVFIWEIKVVDVK